MALLFGIRAIFFERLGLLINIVDDLGYVTCRPRNILVAPPWTTTKRHQLKEVQHRDKILAINEFNFPFPRFDILLKEGAIILRLHGFKVVSIIGLNSDLARVGALGLLVDHCCSTPA